MRLRFQGDNRRVSHLSCLPTSTIFLENMADAAFLQHLLSQTQANITFLASQGYIPTTDATDMITRLATAHTKKATSPNTLASSVQSLSIAPSAPTPAPVAEPPVRRAVPVPPPRTQKAKALWAYNEDGSVCLFLFCITITVSTRLNLEGTQRPRLLIRRNHRNSR